MTDEQKLRKMAAWIRKHGFTPEIYKDGDLDCGCFINAAWRTGVSIVPNMLYGVVGEDLGESGLRAAGWDETATDDAAAACLIAADLCAP